MEKKKPFLNFLKGWGSSSEDESQEAVATAEKSEKRPRRNYQDVEIEEEVATFAVERLEKLLEEANFSGKVNLISRTEGRLRLEIADAGEDAGRLIGKNGGTLEALQILVRSFIIRKFSKPVRVSVDAGEYRNRRFSQLKGKALKAAESVTFSGRSVKLSPMTAAERKEIHMLFEKDKNIGTVSEGEGLQRRVVLIKREQPLES